MTMKQMAAWGQERQAEVTQGWSEAWEQSLV
jgi:hypothetical protein